MDLLLCPACGRPGLTLEVFEADGTGRARHGRYVCGDCGCWHRLEHYIADFLPPALKDQDVTRAFADRWHLEASRSGAASGGELQREQIAFFRENAPVYDDEVTNSTFYRLSDRMSFHRWIPTLDAGGLVLDLGCGTGRQCVPLAEAGHEVIAADISEAMLRLAAEKLAASGHFSRVRLHLADAGRLPFRDGIADAAICYGALHHFPSPGAAIAEAGRVLRRGGHWYSYDPHRSPVRFIFEAAMKLWKLYDELAAAEPLLAREALEEWCARAEIEVSITYHAYILPHIVNLMGESLGGAALAGTDALFRKCPGIDRLAGLIISEGTKVGGLSRRG